MNRPEKRAEAEKAARELLPLLSDYVSKHARERPDALAIIEHDTGEKVTWARLEQAMDAFAAKLLGLGLRKGDVIATSLAFFKEHVFLEYACFKTGIVIAPLDPRLKAAEVAHCFERIRPKAYFFLGNTPKADFRPIVREVMAKAPYCRTWVQFQAETGGVIDGAVHIKQFAKDIPLRFVLSKLTRSVARARRRVGKRDPALIIFTTGSTGLPKAAMLCHENVLLQNVGLAVGFEMSAGDRMVVNLPPSHVGGQTEQLMTTIYCGATSVLLHIFDAEKTLQAIEDHQATLCGQIPALFNLEWRLPGYQKRDLHSLRFALYGGQAVDLPFLRRLREMAPKMGTGLGLTETAGFCTYTPVDWKVEEIAQSIGFDSPLCPISVREPMAADGAAGKEAPAGGLGEICFTGPQVFLGYMNDEEATRRTISKDGFCYTGDIGRYDDKGLHFEGRSKFVIKPKGYQVFPAEVESFITEGLKGRVASTGCVAAPHGVFVEAIVAFVELEPGAAVTRAEVDELARGMAAYKRPLHVVFLERGKMPLNRVAKIDYLELQRMALDEVGRLRPARGWDAAGG